MRITGIAVFLETSLVVATLILEKLPLVISSWQLAHDDARSKPKSKIITAKDAEDERKRYSLMTGKTGDLESFAG